MGLFHGILLRRLTGGQLPVVSNMRVKYCNNIDLIGTAVSEVSAERKESGKVWCGEAHHEVCVKLEQK